MQRYFIRFSYDGTQYHGWQRQPGDASVQETMEGRMQCLFGDGFALTGAGRTDAGVHASRMWAHFDLPQALENPSALVEKLNRMFPDDIAVQEIRPVRPDAHARFDALSRTYEYRFSLTKNPYDRLYATPLPARLDVAAMQAAADVLDQYTDFTSLSKLHTDVKTNNCRIMKAVWEFRDSDGRSIPVCFPDANQGALPVDSRDAGREDLPTTTPSCPASGSNYPPQATRLVFTVQADRFLRNMVRALVGTLLEVGRGKLTTDGFRRIIESKNRCAAGTSMPPQGLFLTDVAYPADIFITD